jgi:hypothetical protein
MVPLRDATNAGRLHQIDALRRLRCTAWKMGQMKHRRKWNRYLHSLPFSASIISSSSTLTLSSSSFSTSLSFSSSSLTFSSAFALFSCISAFVENASFDCCGAGLLPPPGLPKNLLQPTISHVIHRQKARRVDVPP